MIGALSLRLGEGGAESFLLACARSLHALEALPIGIGPWLRRALDLSSGAFIALGHCLYFTGPLLLWAVLRVLEPNRLFSRLFLAMALALVYFLTELVIGAAFWMNKPRHIACGVWAC